MPGGAPKGNQNAFKGRIWAAAVKRALDRRAPANKKIQAIDELADKLLDLGFGGELSALQEIGSRLEGKPAQSVQLAAEIIDRNYNELSDAELLAIAAGSGDRAPKSKGGKKKSTPVH